MSNLAIAHFLQSFLDWRSIHAPQLGERRYCPVFKTRGQPAQYLDKHDQNQSALVAENDTAFFEDLLDLETGEDRKSLIDYILDAIPWLKSEEAASAVAFHNVTEKDLPPCHFMTGETLVWNDHFLPPGHKARKHCGEGPFRVERDESYVVEINISKSARTKTKIGNNRLVLRNLSNDNLIIAHGSLFIEANIETH